MNNITKQQIIKEICRTAEENNGVPLGIGRFEKETSINSWQWGQFWARFSTAQKEAGLTPNQLQTAHDETFLIEKLVELIRKLKKLPTLREMVVARNSDPELPSKGSFQRLGTQRQLAKKVVKFCENKEGYNDVIKFCQPFLNLATKKTRSDESNGNQLMGEVYLLKSGRYYKIGKTNDIVRRGKELKIQLPEKCTLIHSIITDDPSGIETYWHKRFASKRMQVEWFDLNSSEIKAFKRWKKIF